MHSFVPTLLAVLIFLASYAAFNGFFSSVKRSALRLGPREIGTSLEFFPAPRMQRLVRMVLVLLLSFSILVGVASLKAGEGLYASLIPLVVFFLILLVRPVPVVVDQDGIRQSRWLLPDKVIAWKDVESVAYGRNTGTTYVLSRNGGPKIRFSVFLVGHGRFQQEIRAHAHENAAFLE